VTCTGGRERVLLDVCLGQRQRTEDRLDLGRGFIRRGLRSPLLVVSDGAPGLIRAITELWPGAEVIGRFPGETSCLTTAWAVMDLVIAGSRGLGLTLPDRHAITALVAARAVPQTAQQIA
jgi:hypothetical protein